MTNLQKIPAPLSTFTDKALPHSSLSPTTSLLSNYKRKSLEQSGMVAAAGAVHPHASAQSDHESPPRPLLLTSIIFLEISLVFTHGITPARVNHNKCFIKKCILMFRAMHEHLASTPAED